MPLSMLPALFLLVQAIPRTAGPVWQRDWEAALTQAQERRLPLLIRFVATDCATASGQPTVAAARRGGATGGGRGSLPPLATSEVRGEIDDCRRMEEDVWSAAEVAEVAGRYVAVIEDDSGDRRLVRRYEVGTFPTTLFADPWGNEIVRLVHYVPRERLLRLASTLAATDFSGVETTARVLRENPHDAGALGQAASFYEKARLPEIADRYYERALLTEAARHDATLRRKLAIARGTNLLRIGKAAEAVAVFRQSFEQAPEAPQGDVVLFAWMMAELQQGRTKEADRPYRELLERFPQSRYAAKAKENMAAAQRR